MHEMKSIRFHDEEYPELLRHIADPPKILYYIGNVSLLNKPAISIVGTRKATSYGRWASYGLAKKLAEYRIVVVSGMASGIDTFAHRGAVENSGETIAVLGCGADVCYPASNRNLRDQIAESGLIVSEYEPGTTPLPYRFPMRNRIISGLCAGTVVIEAGLQSGSLITAEYAAEQGRNIYALPGNINSMYSFGANKLIKDGAVPIIVFDDIIEDLGIPKHLDEAGIKIDLGKDEREIFEFIMRHGETTSEMLCKCTGKPPCGVNAIVTILEMKGLIQTAFGKIFIAN